MDEYYNSKINNIAKNLIFEYDNPKILNQTLITMDNLSVENIQNSILKLYRTGGNHVMMVDGKKNMYLQVNNINNSAYETKILKFNLEEIFKYNPNININ